MAILALRTAVSMGTDFYLKPGVKANIQYLFQLSAEHPDAPADHPAATPIAQRLADRGLGAQRIGVDGLPGSGKSTLARALAERMGMQWACLDHQLSDEPMDFSAADAVYEHHRLFRTQDLDSFDVLVYLDEPMSKIREQIINRGRGAALIEVLDFDRMREIGRKAFALAGGEEWQVPGTNVRLKTRPPEGFHDLARLDGELQRLGFRQTQDLPKEAKLFLAVYGRAKRGSLAYVQAGQFFKELLVTAAREATGRRGGA